MIGAIARAAPSPVTAAPADERLLLSEAEVNETIVALDEFLDKQERNQQRLHKYIVDDAIQMVSEFGKAREFIKDSIQALATRASEPVNPARIVLADIFTREDAREGLALWLPETDDVDVALRLCDSIRAHIAADNGNAMRTAASDLIKLYSRALEVSISPTDRPDSLAAHIKAISARVSCLTPTPSAPAVDTDAIRLTNALTTIRLIGNWASHTVNSTLGYFKLLEVCSAFGTLAEILPQVFKLHIASKDKKNRQLSETSIRSTESPELTKTVVVEVNGVKITQPAKPGMQVEAATEQLSYNQSDAATASLMDCPPGLALRSTLPERSYSQTAACHTKSSEIINKASTLGSTSAATVVSLNLPQLPKVISVTPGQKLKFREIRATEPQVSITYRAMLRHMDLVDAARLCVYGPKAKCKRENCTESHSYFDVMTYNPMYKTITCIQRHHFNLERVEEVTDCVCGHVDLNVSFEWKSKDKNGRNCKLYLCSDRHHCLDLTCMKSHTVEEISWYNPFFRSKICEFPGDCTKGPDCLGLHPGKSKPEYVGVKSRILFLERTHKEFARRLTALDPRFASS